MRTFSAITSRRPFTLLGILLAVLVIVAFVLVALNASATNMGQLDVNVIVLYTYGPLTPLVQSQFGVFRVAVNQHMTVQGS